jgi:hypothetical protein
MYPEFFQACEYCEQVIFAFWAEWSATGKIVPLFSKMRGQKFFGFTDKVETEIKGEISFLEVVKKSKARD